MSLRRWVFPHGKVLALGVLMAGMALVQLGPAAGGGVAISGSSAAIGAAAVLASSFFSGLANIIFEKVLPLDVFRIR